MVATVRSKFQMLDEWMDEKLRRHWAACEALALGRGGISAVSKATGLSRNTIRRGIREVQSGLPQLAEEIEQRTRRPGGGRRRLVEKDSTLQRDLLALLEENTRGDPRSPLQWTCKSTRALTDELTKMGHQASRMTVDRMLQELGYNLQANRKIQEGKQHPDRDAQFRFIARKVQSFQRRRQPVISVDAKKREILGNHANPGREWRPKGHPEEVNVHDFRDSELGVAIPYSCYDLTRNEGWVNLGITHNTAEFATSTIRHWWYKMGSEVYPEATELLITADAGSSNGYRVHMWKVGLQRLADETGLCITVCHFPPGTSKWNKIDHRLFCHITGNWRARPLVSMAVVVNLIGATTTREGLRVRAEVDSANYETGVSLSKEEYDAMNIVQDKFHGEWNYAIRPHDDMQ